MIKRLKWNVLYGDEDDAQFSDGSDGSARSNDSAKVGTAEAQTVLDALARNDPNLAMSLRQDGSTSDESDQNEQDSNTREKNVSKSGTKVADAKKPLFHSGPFEPMALLAREDAQVSEKSGEQLKGAEWRECALCPGRRFLNDEDVQKHLKSVRHLKRVDNSERENYQLNSQTKPGDIARSEEEEKKKEEKGANKKEA